MTLTWPVALWVLAVVPIGAAIALLVHRRRSRYAAVLPNLDVLTASAPRSRRWPQRVAAGFFVLAIGVLAVALARPEMPFLTPREDATVVLVLDTSGSMIAPDVAPSRLHAATDAARAFVDTVPERLRVGLVGFSDTADVLAWPTTDRNLVHDALRDVEPRGGTAIGDGLIRALRTTGLVDRDGAPVAVADDDRPYAVLLLSDGRNNAGAAHPEDAAATARALRVPVFTVALAPQGGVSSLIAVPPGDGADIEMLERIARVTGARSFSVHDGDTLEAVYRDLGSRMGFERTRQEVTYVFAGAAAVLLAGATAMSAVRRPATP